MMKRLTIAALSLAVLFAGSAASLADPVADFYRGKTMRMIIGYGVGGGYDLYGRIAAEFLPRHIPGHPTIVPQNMPGAGSLKAANFI
jgi:tripartite-type tricarboxylate transporter receptor subunit TctC